MAVDTWESVEKDALWALEHAREFSPGRSVDRMRPLLRLWTYSSEGAYIAWTVLSPRQSDDQDSPMVREVVWRRQRDEQHLASVNRKHMLRKKLQSTLRCRDADVSSEELAPFIKTAASLFVPAILMEDTAPESDVCGIEGYGSLSHLRMEWKGPCPVEWAQPVAWVADLRDLLVASLVEREEGEKRQFSRS
jgi:hypothetical protein